MFKLSNKVAIICFTLLFCGLLPGFVRSSIALDRVSWEQLPYYLESQGISLKELSVCDCPAGLNQESPSHQVFQIIGNTLYEWNEFEFTNEANETKLAVRMLRPVEKRLSASEARVLLTASSALLVKESRKRGALAMMSVPDEPCEGLLRGDDVGYRTAIKTSDNRVKVKSEWMTDQPFITTAFLEIVFAGESFRGTGFLITPTCVLTAGQNIYFSDLTGNGNGFFVDQITVTPAQYVASDGVNLVMPYGQRTSEDLRSNNRFQTDTNDLSEHDFGAIFIETPFVGIDTFVPLEFNHLPDEVLVPGYPGQPHGMADSFDMWFTIGPVLGTRGEHDQIINFSAYISSGNSGSPIVYRNRAAKEYRLVGVVTWEDVNYDSGVRLTGLNRDLIVSWLMEEPENYTYDYDYYVPYYLLGRAVWNGLALANSNTEENHILIQYFTAQGDAAGSKSLSLVANGQDSFVCQPDRTFPIGWIKVSSTLPLYGLALVGSSFPSTMFDMDLQGDLHKKFIFPHLAADGKDWDSIAMLCNPNGSEANVRLTYYPKDGVSSVQKSVVIPVRGSASVDLKQLFLQDLNGGHIILQSTQSLAAFLLYDGSSSGKNNWEAGLSAVPMD